MRKLKHVIFLNQRNQNFVWEQGISTRLHGSLCKDLHHTWVFCIETPKLACRCISVACFLLLFTWNVSWWDSALFVWDGCSQIWKGVLVPSDGHATGSWVLGPQSPSLFPSSAGAACKTTDILGLVLKADKPRVGLWILILVRVELNIVPVAWSAMSWLPEGTTQPPSYVWCSLVMDQWDYFSPKIRLQTVSWKRSRKSELKYELKTQWDSSSVVQNI